jgi:hypothetical protein
MPEKTKSAEYPKCPIGNKPEIKKNTGVTIGTYVKLHKRI